MMPTDPIARDWPDPTGNPNDCRRTTPAAMNVTSTAMPKMALAIPSAIRSSARVNSRGAATLRTVQIARYAAEASTPDDATSVSPQVRPRACSAWRAIIVTRIASAAQRPSVASPRIGYACAPASQPTPTAHTAR